MSIHFTETKILSFVAKDLFNLVADVESYPKFIKGCKALTIEAKTAQGFRAKVTAGMGVFGGSYTCDVVLTPYSQICVEYIEGPFQHLKNLWSFEDLGHQQTRVTFDIAFAFSSAVQQFFMEGVFAGLAKDVMLSFEKEASVRFLGKAS